MARACDHASCEPAYCDHKCCEPDCAERARPCPYDRPRPSGLHQVCPFCGAAAGAPCQRKGRHPRRLEDSHPSRRGTT